MALAQLALATGSSSNSRRRGRSSGAHWQVHVFTGKSIEVVKGKYMSQTSINMIMHMRSEVRRSIK